MRDFVLLGGPFDGATGDFTWPNEPPVVWAVRDPSSRGPFGGRLLERHRPGAFPYNLAKVTETVLTFVFSELTDEGYLKVTEETKELTRAIYDWERDGLDGGLANRVVHIGRDLMGWVW